MKPAHPALIVSSGSPRRSGMPGPDRWWAARDGLPTMVTALLTFTMLFATASCSNSDDDEAMRRIEAGGFDSLELSGGQLNEALRDASDYQRQVLIDAAFRMRAHQCTFIRRKLGRLLQDA